MNPQPTTTRFDWSIYADATLAGLSVLVPAPFVDDALEGYFRKRMPRRIAAARGRTLPDEVEAELREEGSGWGAALLRMPVTLTVGLVKRISRKVLYFLTVKAATDALSHYWHRAFLLDHALAAGHLENAASARIARRAMDGVLTKTSGPLRQLARQLVTRVQDVPQLLRRAREGHEEEAMRQASGPLEEQWEENAGYLKTVAARYDEAFRQLQQSDAR